MAAGDRPWARVTPTPLAASIKPPPTPCTAAIKRHDSARLSGRARHGPLKTSVNARDMRAGTRPEAHGRTCIAISVRVRRQPRVIKETPALPPRTRTAQVRPAPRPASATVTSECSRSPSRQTCPRKHINVLRRVSPIATKAEARGAPTPM